MPYDTRWLEEFRRLGSLLRPGIPGGGYLHHIGSTAVPGLPAKDVIDVQLTVNDLSDVDPSIISRCGFVHVPGMSDHEPPGMSLNCADLSKLFFRSTYRLSNLHVRQRGRFNQRYALLCRDFLRSNTAAATAYASVKIALADRFSDDPHSYYAVKDPVFDIIMAGAALWAERTDWREPPPD